MRLYLLLLIFLIGCGEPVRERSTAHTSKLTDRDIANENFVPEFDKVRKSEIFVAIEPDIEPESSNYLEEQGLTQDIIERSKNYSPPYKSVYDIDLDDGFKYVGRYIEDGCLVKMHKKSYRVRDLFIHIDCKGNRIKIHKDKKEK